MEDSGKLIPMNNGKWLSAGSYHLVHTRHVVLSSACMMVKLKSREVAAMYAEYYMHPKADAEES
jgi:hypothetical protein